nr:N-6 DNA methylase [Kibdelosporangium sp. MJ126-NF4]CEL22551.1 type II restriction-modification system DNA adenine-specific methylase [Kibdelosporangium sp. MJ126-NF4]CTQ89407.1 type II restriction-modification system DNA adenine-specific methylase [Kibdelosporangium sp. MJ126-NF4]
MSNEAAVTAADIARLAGVGRAAVSNWRRRYEDFPAPVGGTPNSPLFTLAEVERWLREQGKLQTVSPWERLWQLVEAHRGDQEPADVLAAIGSYLLRRSDGHPVARAVLQEVAVLADHHGPLATAEALWDRFVQANARWMAVTTPEMARLIAELTGLSTGVALDPACGAGSLLAAVAGRTGGVVHCLGQEIDHGLAALADARLGLRGVPAEIQTADSLLHDAYRGRLADAVVCDPPVGERQWGHEELLHDERWEYGIPPRMESELAWVQHALAHVKPGGLVAILMPPSVAGRRSGRRIRAELLRRGALRAVMALPGPVHLWMLRKPGKPADPHVLVLEATTAEWDQAAARAVAAWRAFDAPDSAAEDEPGVSRMIPVLDLLGEEVDLTPARNLPITAAPDTAEKLLAGHRELTTRLSGLAPLLPTLDWTGSGRRHRLMTTVGELIKTGALTLLQSDVPANPAGDAVPVLDLADVLADRPASRRISRDLSATAVRVQAGDVVLPTAGHKLVARVVNDPGAVLGRGLCLLRPNPDVLDPWFLAGFLGGSANSRQASTHLSSASRLDVRRCEVPRMPLAEQHRYAAVFSALGTFGTAVGRAGALAEQVIQATVDGLVDGLVAPERT